MTITIRPATDADLDETLALLAAAGLPTEDVTNKELALAAESGGELLGVVGLESFSDAALLRSLVVSEAARGSGVGKALVTALEGACCSDGIAELWLLTIDADEYFRKLGYTVRARPDAPGSIRGTAEFSSLCPDDAVLMSKALPAGQHSEASPHAGD